MFDLGLIVEMTEYQESMNILLSMFDADTSFDEVASIDFDRVASTSNREVLRELNQAFSTKEAKISQPQTTGPREKGSQLSQLKNYKNAKNKGSHCPPKKNTKWGVRQFFLHQLIIFTQIRTCTWISHGIYTITWVLSLFKLSKCLIIAKELMKQICPYFKY